MGGSSEDEACELSPESGADVSKAVGRRRWAWGSGIMVHKSMEVPSSSYGQAVPRTGGSGNQGGEAGSEERPLGQ